MPPACCCHRLSLPTMAERFWPARRTSLRRMELINGWAEFTCWDQRPRGAGIVKRSNCWRVCEVAQTLVCDGINYVSPTEVWPTHLAHLNPAIIQRSCG